MTFPSEFYNVHVLCDREVDKRVHQLDLKFSPQYSNGNHCLLEDLIYIAKVRIPQSLKEMQKSAESQKANQNTRSYPSVKPPTLII